MESIISKNYIGFCDYGFRFSIKLFGKDIAFWKVPYWFWNGKLRLTRFKLFNIHFCFMDKYHYLLILSPKQAWKLTYPETISRLFLSLFRN